MLLEAKRRRRSKSAVAREILTEALGEPRPDPELEARRQSLLVSGRASETETLEFVASVADKRGWK